MFIIGKMKSGNIRGDSDSLVFSLKVLVPVWVILEGAAGNVMFLWTEE